MKRTLQILALVVALGGVIIWAATGANRGWTKTEKPSGIVDEVTGIVDQTPVKCFSPGVDFLGAVFGAAALLAGTSFFFRKPKTNQPNQ